MISNLNTLLIFRQERFSYPASRKKVKVLMDKDITIIRTVRAATQT